jgi:hypothetical protein
MWLSTSADDIAPQASKICLTVAQLVIEGLAVIRA